MLKNDVLVIFDQPVWRRSGQCSCVSFREQRVRHQEVRLQKFYPNLVCIFALRDKDRVAEVQIDVDATIREFCQVAHQVALGLLVCVVDELHVHDTFELFLKSFSLLQRHLVALLETPQPIPVVWHSDNTWAEVEKSGAPHVDFSENYLYFLRFIFFILAGPELESVFQNCEQSLFRLFCSCQVQRARLITVLCLLNKLKSDNERRSESTLTQIFDLNRYLSSH